MQRSASMAAPPAAAVEFPPTSASAPFPGLRALAGQNLAVAEEIGKGRFKQVHRGWLRSGCGGEEEVRDVVVLRYAKGSKESKNELEVLALLVRLPRSRPHVPETFGAIDELHQTVVVQERAVLGSLKAALLEPEVAAGFSPGHKLQAAEQVARAMSFLESVRLVHADLSCRNVLLFRLLPEDTQEVLVKVTDFGLSLLLQEGGDCEVRKQPQATRWCAPETVFHRRFSHRSDVWSLGATLWELFAGGMAPWSRFPKRKEVSTRLSEIAQGQLEVDLAEEFPAPEGCPAAAHWAIMSCLQVDETARPTALEVSEALLRAAGRKAALVEADGGSESSPKGGDAVTPGDDGNDGHNAATSTPSTSATPTAPWLARWPKDGSEAGTPPGRPRVEVLAERLLDALAELAAPDREEALAGLAQRLLGSHAPPAPAVGAPQRRPAAPRPSVASLTLASPVLGGGALSPLPRSCVPSPASCLRELLVPLTAEGAPLDSSAAAPPPLGGSWTVQCLVHRTLLRRQEYADEPSARVAFRACVAASLPCILRDPCGVRCAAQSWLVMDFGTPQCGDSLEAGRSGLALAMRSAPAPNSAPRAPPRS